MGRFVSIAATGILMAIFFIAFPLHAQTADPGIEQRMQNQEKRIDQGVESGALTPKEAGNLEAQQARIKQREEHMKADGKLTPEERLRLTKAQNRASKNIYRKKHNK
jgi:hypothetical protein